MPSRLPAACLPTLPQSTAIIFHCEFSTERGPRAAKFVRNKVGARVDFGGEGLLGCLLVADVAGRIPFAFGPTPALQCPVLIAGLCCASTAVTQDREAHLHDYPALSYPHVFVLQVRPSPVPVGLSCRGCAASRCARCASMPPRCVSVYAQPTVHFGTCLNPASPAALPLQGGFKAFWRSFSELCEGGYVPMDHKDYTQQFKVRWWKFEVGVG